jgi:chromosome segregation ATPase
MTKITKKCNNNNNDSCKCDGACEKQCGEETKMNYGFYSKVLSKPFDSLSELKAAEEAYYGELKIKEDAAAQKKADAQKVEDAFKDLNAARKAYKEDLTQLTKEFSEELDHLKKAFDLGKEHINEKLAAAEDAYSAALKEFTTKYENYHMTLKDGDFETTISSTSNASKSAKTAEAYSDLFKWIFGLSKI